jgi:hypothetical protein
MKIPVLIIQVRKFNQEFPSWKHQKDIEKVGRKTLLRALEETEANL